MRKSLYLFVCMLSALLSRKPLDRTSPNFIRLLPVAVAQSFYGGVVIYTAGWAKKGMFFSELITLRWLMGKGCVMCQKLQNFVQKKRTICM